MEGSIAGRTHVVFWDAAAQGATAFHTELDGVALTFEISDGEIVDLDTGSTWTLDGRATAGPLQRRTLEAVSRAFVAFWFAWPGFYPDIQLWSP